MNGVCGSFSIFSSARYLITNDFDYLWMALAFPLAGLMFDFLDGKVARWRKSSSMLGQELDSLADLVCTHSRSEPHLMFAYKSSHQISFGVAPSLLAFVVGLRTYRFHLLWSGSTGPFQRNCRPHPQGCVREGSILRRLTHPFVAGTRRHLVLLDKARLDRREGGYSLGYGHYMGRGGRTGGYPFSKRAIWPLGNSDG
jgi:hypothetical protein